MGTSTTDETREEGLADRLPDGTIEFVAFLARSKHRVRVLGLLADSARTRDELSRRTDVTRVTLSRILGDLTDRELVAHDAAENTYTLTEFGDLVYRDLTSLLGTVSVGRAYPETVERLPTEAFDFDLGCLSEGSHITGASADPMAAARVVADAIRSAGGCEAFVGTFTSLPMYAFEEVVAAGEGRDTTVVFDARVTETVLGDPTLSEKWREIEAASESTVYYGVDERIPYTVDLVGDDTVFLTVEREQEGGFDVIRCEHPDVLAWAHRTIEEHRARATPLRQLADRE